MAESGPGGNHESVRGINPGPNAALDSYFSRMLRPTDRQMIHAADLIRSAHREIEHTQDTLNICMDLVRDVPHATTVLAGMINIDHEAIPKRWKHDPQETKMVLSMSGHVEIGTLRALQCSIRRGPPFIELDEEIHQIEQLIDDLQ